MHGLKHDGSPAPQHRLADLREWLTDRIDGGEEMRGEDGLVSDFIRQIDAQDAELADIKQRLLPQFQGRTQRAEHERDALLEELIALRSRMKKEQSNQQGILDGSHHDAREPAPTGCGAIFKESEGWSCDCERAHPAPCKVNAPPTTKEQSK